MSQVTSYTLDCCCNSPSCSQCEGGTSYSGVSTPAWTLDTTSCECTTCFPRYPSDSAPGDTPDGGYAYDFWFTSVVGDEQTTECCSTVICPDQLGGKLYLWNVNTNLWELIYGCCKGSATATEPPFNGATYNRQGTTVGQIAWVCCTDPCDCTPSGYTWWEAKFQVQERGATVSWTYVEDDCNSACAKRQPPPDFVLDGGRWPTRWYTRTCCTAGCVSCTQESMYDPDEDLILTLSGVTGLLENASGHSPPAGTINCDGAVANDVWSAIFNKSWSIPNLYPTGGGCQFSLTENLCILEDTCAGPSDATMTLTISVTFTSTETTVVFQLATGCGGLGQTRTFVKTHSGSLNCKSVGNIPFSSKSFSGYGGDPTTMYGLDASGLAVSIP